MAVELKKDYKCIYDPAVSNTPGKRTSFTDKKVMDQMQTPPIGDAFAFAIQCARDVYMAKDVSEPRRWLISTDNDARGIKKGYDFRVYDSIRCKHKLWATVKKTGQFPVSFFGLDDEPQDAKPPDEVPTFEIPALLIGVADEQVKRFIEATAYRGPDDSIHGSKFKLKETVGVQHRTQKASNNTVFYVWERNKMKVIGIGGHTRSNTEYEYTDTEGRKQKHQF